MNFDLGEEARAFREEVRAFVRDHPPEEFPHDGMDGGYGSGAHSRAYIEALAQKGWMTMTWLSSPFPCGPAMKFCSSSRGWRRAAWSSISAR